MNVNWGNGKERLKTGIYLASNSFAFLWKHKILLLYLAVGIGTYLLMQMISYNVGGCDIFLITDIQGVGPLFDLSRWHHYLWLLILTFIYIFLSTFVTVCLIYHVNQLLRYKKVTIKETVMHVAKKLQLILVWSIIITVLAYLIQLTSSFILQPKQFFNPLMLLISVLGLAWTLITFMVLPIIAIERTTIAETFKESKNIVIALLPEIIAGELWIILIALLAMIPFAIPILLLQMNWQIPNFLILIITFLIFTIWWVISTVHVIFKTTMYNYYIKPIKELNALKYPRF
ncbi:hypothetical protein E3J79_00720 [Candidatus Dependentiae bacterium]|nr:MAG: hypothetical protein E3J79_00720 [Candidatus Dependentiae bacterium]